MDAASAVTAPSANPASGGSGPGRPRTGTPGGRPVLWVLGLAAVLLCGGQLQRQRQAVQAYTDCRYYPRIPLCQHKLRICVVRARDKQAHRFGLRHLRQ